MPYALHDLYKNPYGDWKLDEIFIKHKCGYLVLY